ncbi:MAG: tetratricopeptide repeat protein [Bacteroidota bacterium]|jgi:tetratricopeptide (TPR) repeat protein|nr:tetratricopeptide repeat protein [Bacteroidota bacterium]
MDNDQSQPEQMNKSRNIKIAVISILLLLPIVFLLVKFSKSPDGAVDQKTQNAAAPPIDIAAFENAVKSNPTFDNYIGLSNAYVNSNMPGKSVDPLMKAIELNPKSAIAYNNLGVAYTMLQQYNKGIEACTRALEIDSSFQLAKNNLNWANSEKKNVIAFLEKQSETPEASRDAQFYTNYGLAYLKLGDYDKSIEAWNQIFKYDPKSIVALNNIGTAFMMKNQVDDAVAVFKKAVEYAPEDQLSKNNLAWAMAESAKLKKQ